MSAGLKYIEDTYGLVFKRGDRVVMDGRPGTVVGARGGYLRVRFDDRDTQVASCHPTWRLTREDT